jgi:hypothetical protein
MHGQKKTSNYLTQYNTVSQRDIQLSIFHIQNTCSQPVHIYDIKYT